MVNTWCLGLKLDTSSFASAVSFKKAGLRVGLGYVAEDFCGGCKGSVITVMACRKTLNK